MLKNSLNVSEFCFQENISRSMFYKILKLGFGPKIMKIGRRTLITEQSANEWRKKMEKRSIEGENYDT